ncbi:MAG: ABC transporter permease [Nitriliruptor sp.]|nr:MAG: ABC transporter permease [Nitriliruptor sp.]
MSLARSWQVLRKDLRLGPRSPIVLWALVIPVLITLLVRGVFGGLFAGEPRLGFVDLDGSAVAVELADRDGIELHPLADGDSLRAELTAGRLDAGLLLPEGFDAAVRAGENPLLQLWYAGESVPADRAVLTAMIIDAVRSLTGVEVAVDVEVVVLGDEVLPIELRLLPLIVLYAVAIPGGMVPAASLVEEKERGTLQGMLATPATLGEVMVAKALLGIILGVLAGTVTLAINDAFGAAPLGIVLSVLVGAVMMALIGLLLGAWAPDTNTLFAAWKGVGVLLFLPAIFFIWPGLPMWPARWMPAYYFLRPAFAVSVEGATLADAVPDLAIGLGICLVLIPAVVAAGRHLERRLVTGRVEPDRRDEPDREPQPV